MVTLTSTTSDPQALVDAFVAHGIKPEVATSDKGETVVQGGKEPTGDTPVEGQAHSESDPVKGDKPKDEPKKEAPAGEEKPKEEAKPEVKEEPKTEDKPKSKGGFQAKVEKLTATADRLRDDLEAERGSKAKLQAQLDEVNGKLAELKPKEEPKTAGPEKPKRPTRAESDFDDDKYEVAMAKYDSELSDYTEATTKLAVEKAKADLKKEQAEAESNRAEQARKDAFAEKLNKGREGLEDWDELVAEIPDDHSGLLDKSRVANDYLLTEAENPAILMHFLMKDAVENDGAESDRLLSLSPFKLVIELRAIEERLSKPAAPIVDLTPKTETPVVKEQPKPKKAVPEEPLETVGGRTSGTTQDLEARIQAAAQAGDAKLFRDLREQQKAAKRPARVA